MKASFRREAQGEMVAAAFWYDERVPGLGSDFPDEVDAAVGRIEAKPEAWGNCHESAERIG
jgi:hypothetical protein